MTPIGHPQRFLDMIKANETAKGFYYRRWITPAGALDSRPGCGTVGCLAGNYYLAAKRCGNELKGLPSEHHLTYECLADHLGITMGESIWLFCPEPPSRYISGLGLLASKSKNGEGKPGAVYFNTGANLAASPKFRPPHDITPALARLRKFAYYKLRKRELMYEADGRVKESARRTEGDCRVDLHVAKELAAV